MLHLGQAFFTPSSEEAGVGRHLWIVLSDPAQARVVIANLSTLRPGRNYVGCVVNAREHASIAHASVLRCDHARLTAPDQLEGLIARRTIQDTTDASPALVKRLQASLCESPETPNEVKDTLRAQGFCGVQPAPSHVARGPLPSP